MYVHAILQHDYSHNAHRYALIWTLFLFSLHHSWVFVRHYLPGRATLPLHQLLEKAQSCSLILALLHQDIENITILIYCTPEAMLFSTNVDENLIHIPCVT